MTARTDRSSILHNHHFLVLWVAQAVSQTAQHVILFTLLVSVEARTHSSVQVGLLILAFMLPAVVLGPPAGVLVDRTNKKDVLLVTNFLRALAVLGYLLVGTDWPALYAMAAILSITFVFSTISQFFGPAEAATIPLLVDRRHLITANSMFNLTYTAAQLTGLAIIGPLLVKIAGVDVLFIIVAALYFICVGLVARLPSSPAAAATPRSGTSAGPWQVMWLDVREGWNFISKDATIVTAIVHLSTASTVFLIIGTLGTGYMTRVIGLPPDDLGYIMAPAGLGMIAGLFLVGKTARPSNREVMINAGLAGGGVVLFGLAWLKPFTAAIFSLIHQVPPPLVLVLLLATLAGTMGVVNSFVLIPAQTVLQERSPDWVRGRVFAVFFMVSNGAAIFPILFAGVLADLIGIEIVMFLVSLLMLAAAGVGMFLAEDRAPRQRPDS